MLLKFKERAKVKVNGEMITEYQTKSLALFALRPQPLPEVKPVPRIIGPLPAPKKDVEEPVEPVVASPIPADTMTSP